MRRKPIFLGYFLLFLVSGFASCQFLNNLLPQTTPDNPGIVQESPEETPEYYDRILSPQAVAALETPEDIPSHEVSISEPSQPTDFVHVDIVSPNQDQPSPVDPALDPEPAPNPGPDLALTPDPGSDSDQQLASTDKTTPDQPVDVPLTNAPVSIFRTVLAVLLAVTALTFAGFSLYQAYEYFAPFLKRH